MVGISVIQGDVIEVLKNYPDESFTAVLCDPPYGLKFMGKEWDHGVPATPYWAEILRVLKPGAILMAFSGTRTWHRLGVAIEDAGFQLFDTMMWLHGQGFPKSYNVGQAIEKLITTGKARRPDRDLGGLPRDRWSGSESGRLFADTGGPVPYTTDIGKTWMGYGTSLKPAFEPILLARKPRNTTYAQTAIEHHTAALNIDGCRIDTKEYLGRPVGQSQSCYEWSRRPNPMKGQITSEPSGRWPANLILDETAAEMLDEQSGERKSGYMKPGQRRKASRGLGGYHGNFPDEATAKGTYGDSGGPSRFFYCTKSNKREREAGLKGYFPCLVCGGIDTTSHINKKESREIPCRRNPHTTVKPLTLCEYLARLVIPPEEYRDEIELLVPFAGVVSEVIGAFLAGWRNITAIELEKDYCEIGQKRVDWWVAKIKETGLTDPKAILKRYKNVNPSN